jgi:hypothetical protein
METIAPVADFGSPVAVRPGLRVGLRETLGLRPDSRLHGNRATATGLPPVAYREGLPETES